MFNDIKKMYKELYQILVDMFDERIASSLVICISCILMFILCILFMIIYYITKTVI